MNKESFSLQYKIASDVMLGFQKTLDEWLK